MKFLLFIFVFSFSAAGRLLERTQAQVGEKMISFMALNSFHKQLKHGAAAPSILLDQIYSRKALLKSKEKLLDFMIDRALLIQMAKEQEITEAEEKDVKAVLSQMRGAASQKAFTAKLRRAGMSLADLKSQIRLAFKNDLLLNQAAASRVIISEQDIESYYFNKNRKPLFNNFEYEFTALSFSKKRKEKVLSRIQNRTESDTLEDIAGGLKALEIKKFKLRDSDIQSAFLKELEKLSVSQISPLIIQKGLYYILQLKWKTPLASPAEQKTKRLAEKSLYKKTFKEELRKWLKEKRKIFSVVRRGL